MKLWLFAREWVVYRLVQAQQFRARAAGKDLADSPVVFVTIAFNDSRLIGLQLEALEKFVAPDFAVLIIDNSLEQRARREIQEVCAQHGAAYLRGPWNLFSLFQGSLSHSSTLDWVWRGLLRRLSAKTIVLLDHDVFPVAPIAQADLLRGAIAAGREERRAGMWYLWPGLLAISLERFCNDRFTFMPYRELDSAGSLWVPYYSRLPRENFTVYSRELVEVMPGTRAEDSSIEVIDGRWIHLIDGSGWLDGTGKFERIFGQMGNSGSLRWDGVVKHLKALGVTIP